jgi:hypothetical protein
LKQIGELSEANSLLKSEAETITTKLDSMSGMGRKHDLLDLELEEAESRIGALTR